MKKLLAFTALLLTAALPSAFAQSSSSVGTWKFDAAQSDLGSQPKPKSMMLVITKDTPQMLAWHVREIDADGKTTHESWHGPQDGSMQTLRRTGGNGQASFQNNNGEFTIHEKMANGVTAESAVTNSDGGNTMTEHVTGTDKKGQQFTETIVWHRVMHTKHKTM
ncbi:MAG: hypothetical protein WAM66_04600 [Acidobacteriaceae bacterium]